MPVLTKAAPVLPEAAEGEGVTFTPGEETPTALVAAEGATGRAEDPIEAPLTTTSGITGTGLEEME